MRNGKEEKNKGSIIKQGNMREWYNRGKKKKKKGWKQERESEKKKVKKREGRGRDDTEVTQIHYILG